MRSYIPPEDQIVIAIAGFICLASLVGAGVLAGRHHWFWASLLFLLAILSGFVAWFFATWTMKMF